MLFAVERRKVLPPPPPLSCNKKDKPRTIKLQLAEKGLLHVSILPRYLGLKINFFH